MSAYANYDRAEESRELKHITQVGRDEWVRARADELAELFPKDITGFASPFGNKFYVKLIGDEAAQELYAEFVDKYCLAKAEWMARENEFLYDNYQGAA